MSERVLRVGLLGCGNVGAAVIRLLHDRTDDIELRADCRLRVTRVAVRNPGRTRDVPIDPSVFTTDSRMPGVPGLIDATSNAGLVPAGACENIGVAAAAMPNTIIPNDLISSSLAILFCDGFRSGAILL